MTGFEVGWLQQLVATPTVSGDRDAQSRLLVNVLEVLRGLASSVVVTADLDGTHPWMLVDVDAPPSVPRLVFACHVDTVPPGEGWSRDPFGGELEDGVVHGRGAADMVGGLVAAVGAATAAADRGRAVALLLTSDEEVGSLGAAAAAPALGRLAVGAMIVPEPTAGRIHLGHRGALWLGIGTAGVAAHGSTPDRGENAILRAAALLGRAGGSLPLRTDSFLGQETWNVGTITGGSVPNVVPDAARFVVDHRTVGDGAELVAWWRAQPETARIETRVALGPVHTSAEAPWLGTLPVVPSPGPVPYFTDASALVPHLSGAPVVIWGPGRPGAMHAVDESVAVAEVDAAVAAFTRVALSWPS